MCCDLQILQYLETFKLFYFETFSAYCQNIILYIALSYSIYSSFSFALQHPFLGGKSGSSRHHTSEDCSIYTGMLFESHGQVGFFFSYPCIQHKFLNTK
jgi:hypothetical protein